VDLQAYLDFFYLPSSVEEQRKELKPVLQTHLVELKMDLLKSNFDFH